MINGTRYVLWTILPVQMGLILLGKPFLTLWLGPRLAAESYSVLVILAIPLPLALSAGQRVGLWPRPDGTQVPGTVTRA